MRRRQPAALKLIVPRDGEAPEREIAVLRLANGEGCARLLRDDPERGALLLERLGRPRSELGRPARARQEILVAAASRVWRPAPDSSLPSGADKARWLAEFFERLWEETGRPCSRRVVDHAVACAVRRGCAHRDETAVLVHGDVHQWNALEAGGGEFKLVDPDGLLVEPEYDLGIVMCEDPLDGDLHERAAWLAEHTGLDETAIWEWGVVERVSSGLLGTRVNLQPVAREMLDAAERLAPE
jgi:streptomycin 6-kinase